MRQQTARGKHPDATHKRPIGLAVLLIALATCAGQAPAAESGTQGAAPPTLADCFKNPALEVPPCDMAGWRTLDITTSQITFLYIAEHFILLERALKQAVSSTKRFDDGDSPAKAAYWAFQEMTSARAAPESVHKERIARWEKAAPNSSFVPIARARLAKNSAWRVRGEGYGGTVSQESWELFRIRLNESIRTLRDAPRETQNTPLWHALLLEATLDTTERANAQAIFAEAVRRWPDYHDFYHAVLDRLVPRWGGSWKQVDAFINDWSSRRAASEGSSLYARLYAGVHRSGYSPQETLMNWPRMKASYEDLLKRYPAGKHKNRYASHACAARDKDAFRSAMSNLPISELDQQQWLSGHSYEACMRWAAV